MRVTLVGDWPLVRSGFRQLLQSAGIGVIASVADAAEAANVLRRGYLGLSQVADADLIEAVRRVAAGERYLGPAC